MQEGAVSSVAARVLKVVTEDHCSLKRRRQRLRRLSLFVVAGVVAMAVAMAMATVGRLFWLTVAKMGWLRVNKLAPGASDTHIA